MNALNLIPIIRLPFIYFMLFGESFSKQLKLSSFLAINTLLMKHESVKFLFDNQWTYLMRLDSSGKTSSRFIGDLT